MITGGGATPLAAYSSSMVEKWFPPMPEFSSPEEERQHPKQRLAAGFRLFANFGFEEGVPGHITACAPVEPATFWVNPFGVPFAHVRASDLIRVNHSGDVVEGGYHVNEAAFAIHSPGPAPRPGGVGAAPPHSTCGRAGSTLGEPLEPITQDVTAFYNDHALFNDYTGVVTDVEEGKRIAHALGDNKAVILRNHGLLTVGTSVDSAVWWFITMERSCQVQLVAKAAGTVVHIDPEMAQQTHDYVGTEFAGWFSFQPLWQKITREQPDLLD